jgi:hypothetical protein
MSSQRKQLNIRMDQKTEALVERLKPAVTEAVGLPVSYSDLFRLGMLELEKRYCQPARKSK